MEDFYSHTEIFHVFVSFFFVSMFLVFLWFFLYFVFFFQSFFAPSFLGICTLHGHPRSVRTTPNQWLTGPNHPCSPLISGQMLPITPDYPRSVFLLPAKGWEVYKGVVSQSVSQSVSNKKLWRLSGTVSDFSGHCLLTRCFQIFGLWKYLLTFSLNFNFNLTLTLNLTWTWIELEFFFWFWTAEGMVLWNHSR